MVFFLDVSKFSFSGFSFVVINSPPDLLAINFRISELAVGPLTSFSGGSTIKIVSLLFKS